MRARKPMPIPTIDELIPLSDIKPVRKFQLDTRRLLKERFSDSIAPLLLLTEQSLHDVDGLGGSKRIALLKASLQAHGLEMRDFSDHVRNRAATLYGTLENTPIQALYLQYAQSGVVTFTHYTESPAVALMARLTPGMTLGDLISMSRPELLKYFDLHGLSLGTTRAKQTADEIEGRLSGWQLNLKLQPARTTVS